MKKSLLSSGIMIVLSSLLFGCVYQFPTHHADYANEKWQHRVVTNEKTFTRGADHWFFTGDPFVTDNQSNDTVSSIAVSTMKVRVSDDFNAIKSDGAYQLQIFGTDEHNTVFIHGPNHAVRNIAVHEEGNVLTLRQINPLPVRVMSEVIVRVGIKNLHELVQSGSGTIEAISLAAQQMKLTTTPNSSGNIYLTGHLQLERVWHKGRGMVSLFGVNTRNVSVTTNGSGTLNMTGIVGVTKITHHGSSDINILGSNANNLEINADGSGKIALKGHADIRRIDAKNKVQIYAYPIDASSLSAVLSGDAEVGLSGFATNLNVKTSGRAVFYGRNLCAKAAYAKSFDSSHINITASNRVFAEALQFSSIYFFGPANLLSAFNEGHGTVLAMDEGGFCNAHSEFRSYDYTEGYRGDDLTYHETTTNLLDYKGEM